LLLADLTAAHSRLGVPTLHILLAGRTEILYAAEVGCREIPADDEMYHSVRAALTRAAIPFHENWEVLCRAHLAGVADLWALDEGPHDDHYGQAGHLLVADWLRPLVDELIAGRSLASPASSPAPPARE
jgi:nitrogen fixation-related uncharacterized protein